MNKIYLIKCDNNGFITYKIGRTSRDINKRINEFKTGNSGDFSLIYLHKTNNASKIELILHNLYKNIKINGEWFNCTLDENKFKDNCIYFENLINTLIKLDNPFI